MADDVTFNPRAASLGTPPGSASDDDSVAQRAKLDALGHLAKAQHGIALNERTLQAILQRRQARRAKQQRIAQNKEAFATEQAKEKVNARAQQLETRRLETTGGKRARGADGLTFEDRQSVRSDPKAGPKLPPMSARATTPEKATELLGLMFASVLIEGKAFDLEAYAETLEQAQPSKPRRQAKQALTAQRKENGRQGRSPIGQPFSARQVAGEPVAQMSSDLRSTTQNAAAQGRPTPTPARPSGSKAEGQAALPRDDFGMPNSSAKLGFRIGTSDTQLRSTSGAGEGLFNAGGGLITSSSFDGMSFNWDAFFSLFLIESQKDLHEWRRLLKELRRLEGDLAVQGHRAQIALAKMRQRFERTKMLSKSSAALGKTREAVEKGQAGGIIHGDPLRAGEAVQRRMRDLVDRARKQGHDIRSGEHLTDSQLESLPGELQEEYRALRAALRQQGGAVVERANDVVDALEVFSEAADKRFGVAVNKAVQEAIGMAKSHRKEVDREIRAVAQRAQGMINQLVLLLSISRRR